MTGSIEASTEIGVSPETAYDAVSDVTRMGEWSPEATGASVKGPLPLQVGSRFRGSNRRGIGRWHTSCTVIAAERGREFGFEVRSYGGLIARWIYRFEPTPAGTRVTESWTDLRHGANGWFIRTFAPLVTGTRDREARNRETIHETLANLKSALEKAA